MNTAPDHYHVLGLAPASTAQEIRRQYRRLVKIYHPDRNPGEEVWCAEQIRKINDAYRVLSSDSLRAEYDRQMQERRRPGRNASATGPEWTTAGDGRSTYSRWRPDGPVPEPSTRPVAPSSPQPSFRKKRDTAKAVAATGLIGIAVVVVGYGLQQPSPIAPTAPVSVGSSAQPGSAVPPPHPPPHHTALTHRPPAYTARVSHGHIHHPTSRLTSAEKDRRAAELAAAIERAKRASGGVQ